MSPTTSAGLAGRSLVTLFEVRGALSEREFSKRLVEFAKKKGYLVNHVYPLRTPSGMRTSTTLRGLPDLMFVGRGHTLWVEVKGPKTPVSAEQLVVLDRFAELCPTNRCWLLRPRDDWELIGRWIVWPEEAPRRYGWDEKTLAAATNTKAGRTAKR